MGIRNLIDLFNSCIQTRNTKCTGLTFFVASKTKTEINLTYKELYDLALEKTATILGSPLFSPGSTVVLYFDNHYESILWFWATVLSGGIPCLCPSLSKNNEQRRLTIDHLQNLFKGPVFLTAEALHGAFAGNASAQIVAVDQM